MIQILETTQISTIDDGGGLRFDHTKVLYRHDDMTFWARLPFRSSKQAIDLERLEDVKCISYRPLRICNHTIAPDPDERFLKRPNSTSCENEDDFTNLVLKELAACDVIRIQPHPNLAENCGCKVSDGFIEGLCFKRYRETLMDAINPDNLNKSMSILAADRAAIRNKTACHFPGIEDGIRHLHKHGLIHNNINPTNIMIDNGPVINNSDSSRAPEEIIHKVKRT
jgi:hypothetical protein